MKLHKNYKTFILLSSFLVLLLGIAVTAYAFLLDAGIADTMQTGNLPLAKDAALCFIFISLSLIIQILSTNSKALFMARFLAVITAVVSFFSILQNCFKEAYDSYLPALSKHIYFGMSVQTALCFILVATAIFYIRSDKKKVIVQGALHVVTCISFIVIIGHLLCIPHFYLLSFFSAMALHTAWGLLLFTIAASFVNPEIGFIGMITGNSIGNVMARRLTFRIFFSVLIISYLLILSYRYDWMKVEFAIVFFSFIFIILSLLFIYDTLRVLNAIERKKEMAILNFQAVIESAPNALVISDMEGNISLVNAQANKIFGYETAELLGKNLEIIMPERFRGIHSARQPHYFKEPRVRHFDQIHDLYALRKDGTEFPVEIGLTPIITDEGTVALASIVDITETRQNEAIIKKQIFEIQAKSHEMEQFIYIASHDLQEPLRTLLNYIQLLEEDYPEQMSGEIGMHLGEMKSAIKRMGILVRSLLDYGRLGQNKVLVLTDTAHVVKDVLADLKTLIKTTGATIEITADMPFLYSYETELRQLFQNLINNAIKFRKQDVPPVITIGCTKEEDYYEFFVADNGIGIDPRYYQRIFLMFQRLHKNEEFKGYGVGLANCRKIAELHGGRIWVESEPGEGSVFKFTISKLDYEQEN